MTFGDLQEFPVPVKTGQDWDHRFPFKKIQYNMVIKEISKIAYSYIVLIHWLDKKILKNLMLIWYVKCFAENQYIQSSSVKLF